MRNDKVAQESGRNESSRRNTSTTVSADTESVKHVMRLEDLSVELLPGIPNDITLLVICTKMSWGHVRTLSSVSLGWRQALERCLIYDSRVCMHSRETLVVLHYVNKPPLHDTTSIHALALYSVRDKAWYDLPSMPFAGREAFECISLDGKIYILGGWEKRTCMKRAEVYVLDLARGQMDWRQCASMHQPRCVFGVGVLNGKMYVFGDDSHLACEVYDPAADSWSKIPSLPESQINHKVATVGEELWIYGGYCPDHGLQEMDEDHVIDGPPPQLLAYHPVKNEWRSIDPRIGSKKEPAWYAQAFMIQGNFHTFTPGGIAMYDIAKGSWSLLHTFSGPFPHIRAVSDLLRHNGPTIPFGDELLQLHWLEECLLLTRGFGSKTRKIALERADCFSRSERKRSLGIFPTQL